MKILLIIVCCISANLFSCQYAGIYGSTEHLELTIQSRNNQTLSASARIIQAIQQPKPAPSNEMPISTPTSPRDNLQRSQ